MPSLLLLPDEAATGRPRRRRRACASRPATWWRCRAACGARQDHLRPRLIRAVPTTRPSRFRARPSPWSRPTTPGRLAIAHFDLYRLSAAGRARRDRPRRGARQRRGAGRVARARRRRACRRSRLDIAFAIAGEGRRRRRSSGGPDGDGAPLDREPGHPRLPRPVGLDRAPRAAISRATPRPGATSASGRMDRAPCSMDLAARPTPPPVLDPRVIFRARDVRAFIAVDVALRAPGLSAPEIHAADTEPGPPPPRGPRQPRASSATARRTRSAT